MQISSTKQASQPPIQVPNINFQNSQFLILSPETVVDFQPIIVLIFLQCTHLKKKIDPITGNGSLEYIIFTTDKMLPLYAFKTIMIQD